MIIYHYDEHGAFLNASNARPNPEEKDEALVPVQATTIQPPGVGAREVPVFDPAAGTWTAQPDRRGPAFDLRSNSETVWDRPGLRPDHLAGSLPPSNFHEWDPVAERWNLNDAARLAVKRARKITETQNEALRRVREHVTELRSYREVAVLYGAIRELTVNVSSPTKHHSAVAVYDYAETKAAELRAEVNEVTIDAYDPTTDPDFPS